MSAPLVTCLTVTRGTPDRLPRLAASLAAYDRQSWPARRLVLVVDGAGDASAVRALVAGRADVTLVACPPGMPLGALRNVAWRAATGDYVCQWDDDDLHHPDRLARQFAALRKADTAAILLADILHFFEAERALYWLNWAATSIGAHPGTLFARRDAAPHYPETGPESRQGEDSAVALALQARGVLAMLAGEPHLSVYVAHGGNVSAMAHHHMLARTLGLSQGLLRRREAIVRAGLAAIDLGGGPVVARGHNGAAFTLDPAPR